MFLLLLTFNIVACYSASQYLQRLGMWNKFTRVLQGLQLEGYNTYLNMSNYQTTRIAREVQLPTTTINPFVQYVGKVNTDAVNEAICC
jgi:hypothetical protein